MNVRETNLLPEESTPSVWHQNKDLQIKDGEEITTLASLLQENQKWKSLRQKKRKQQVSSFTKMYIKFKEAVLENDYPLAAFKVPLLN